MPTLAFTSMDAEVLSFFAIATMIGSALVHIGFAIAVFCDTPPRNALCAKGLWAFGTLFGGVFVAAAYYILHHGITLNSPVLPTHRSQPSEPDLN